MKGNWQNSIGSWPRCLGIRSCCARAQALLNLGRHEDALAATRTCLAAAPRSADCKLVEANVLKKPEDAEAQWPEAARSLRGWRR